jgi:hypothetical protein
MMKPTIWQKNFSILLGFVSILFFVFDAFYFSKIQPKMIRFDAITSTEEGLLNWVGVGLLVFLIFCLLSLLRTVQQLKKTSNVSFISIALVIMGVLALLFVFSDVALLGDIAKQYKNSLDQPEWMLVYPIMGFQLFVALVFTYFHIAGFSKDAQHEFVARDSNIFMVVQFVGVVCGLMGLALASLGFVYASAWSLTVHTTITSIILLSPYGLAVVYWLATKLREENCQWYDEKQLLDVGKSAFLTLAASVVFMIALFIANYNNLNGVISITWLPLYLFFVLFLFSASNLFFAGRE